MIPSTISATASPDIATDPKQRILKRIRRRRRAELSEAPCLAEIVVRVAAALIVVAVCLEAMHR